MNLTLTYHLGINLSNVQEKITVLDQKEKVDCLIGRTSFCIKSVPVPDISVQQLKMPSEILNRPILVIVD